MGRSQIHNAKKEDGLQNVVKNKQQKQTGKVLPY